MVDYESIDLREPVKFKSIPGMFDKEKDGRKPNTLRKIDGEDIRFYALKHGCKRITIINTATGEKFTRDITDYTEWEGYAIISWDSFSGTNKDNPLLNVFGDDS